MVACRSTDRRVVADRIWTDAVALHRGEHLVGAAELTASPHAWMMLQYVIIERSTPLPFMRSSSRHAACHSPA